MLRKNKPLGVKLSDIFQDCVSLLFQWCNSNKNIGEVTGSLEKLSYSNRQQSQVQIKNDIYNIVKGKIRSKIRKKNNGLLKVKTQ